MKKTLIALVLLLLLYIGSQWYTRSATEQSLDDIASYINAWPGYSATPELVAHGLFSSQAILNLKLDTSLITRDMDPVDRQRFSEELGYLERGVNLNLDIHRGPLVFHEGLYPGLYKMVVTADDDIALLKSLLGEDFNLNEYFSLVASMGYFGNGRALLKVVDFNKRVDEVTLEWGGMEHEYKLGGYGRSYEIDGVMQPLLISNSEERLETSSVRLSGEGDFPAAGTYIANGRVRMDMAFVAVEQAGVELFRLEELSNFVDTKVDTSEAGEARFSSRFGMGTGSITSAAFPEPVNSMRVAFAVEGMSVQAFNSFYSAVMDISGNADPQQSQALLMQAAAALLAGNPAFLVEELGFSMGDNKALDLSARLQLGENFVANLALAAMNPAILLNAVELEVTASFTQPLLERVLQAYAQYQLADLELDPVSLQQLQAQQMLQMNAMLMQAVQNGLLQQQGDRLVLQASLAAGALSVNGMPLPVPFLQ